jgi:phosphopantetheinyl transferase
MKGTNMQEYMTEMKTHAWAHTDVHGTLRRSDRNIWRTRTSQMTPRELARVVADWHGWTVRNGYIYANEPCLTHRKRGDQSIAHGYNLLALVLHRLGIIEVGVGIHWRKQWEIAGSQDAIVICSVIADLIWKDKAGKRRKCNG